MDTFSHALWGYAATGRKANFWLAAFFGAFPDLFAFTIPTLSLLFSHGQSWNHVSDLGNYVHVLYSISHSLIICGLVFGIIYLFTKKFYIWMIGWPLHILMDIPSHSKEFFPTPFLYPISNFSVNGVPWSTPWVSLTNWGLLMIAYVYLFRKEIKQFFIKTFKIKNK